MMKHAVAIVVGLTLLASVGAALAQKMTEQFIPIGQSPGLSGVHTRIGTVDSFSSQEAMLTLSDGSASYSVQIAEDTHIWLDKSKLGSTNEVGTAADLQSGRRLEVKYQDNDPDAPAEWIKVEVTE